MIIHAALASALALSTLPAGVAPPAEPLTIETATFAGTGCPVGASAAVRADNSGFLVDLTGLRSEVGPGVPATMNRQVCNVSVILAAPAGYTYAIARTDFRIQAHFDASTSGQFRYTPTVVDAPGAVAQIAQSFVGPEDADTLIAEEIPAEDRVYLSCGERHTVTLATDLRATGTASGWVEMVENPAITLDWKEC